jgi:hypothetical protein
MAIEVNGNYKKGWKIPRKSSINKSNTWPKIKKETNIGSWRGVLDTLVTDLRQVGGFLSVLWFPPTIKLTSTI